MGQTHVKCTREITTQSEILFLFRAVRNKASVTQDVNLSFVFAKTKVRTLTFRKPELQSFKELVNKTPWETALREKGAEQSWQIFTITFHTVQELLITRYKISGQEARQQHG